MSEEKNLKLQKKLSINRESAIHNLLDVLTDNTPISETDANILKEISDDTDPRAMRACARIVYRAHERWESFREFYWDRLEEIDALAANSGTPVGYFVTYVRVLKIFADALRHGRHKSFTALGPDKEKIIGQLHESLGKLESCNPSALVILLAQAKIESLTSRGKAAELFRKAEITGKNFLDAFELDRGVSTYFSVDDVEAVELESVPSIREKISNERDVRLSDLPQPHINLVWSVDPNFLRIHGAHWLNLAPFLLSSGIGMVIIVLGPKEECETAIEDARSLARALFAYRCNRDGNKYAQAIHFVPVEVPDYVSDKKTFFASARYLFAKDIMDALDTPILVLDIDMTLKDPLGSFIESSKNYDFACPLSVGIAGIYPWRRSMAGTVFFNNAPEVRDILRDIARYVRAGLEKPSNWTLDQNALSFAIERATAQGKKFLDYNTVRRPIAQDAARVLFERLGMLK